MPWKDPEARRENRRRRYAEDVEYRERVNAASAAWQEANKEHVRDRQRAWAEANRERRNEVARQWRENNPEKVAAAYRRHKEKNREKVRVADAERKRQRRAEGDPKIREHIRADRFRRRGAKLDGQGREYTTILAGDPCSYCGEPMDTIDHIVPLYLGGDGEWSNLTAACRSCNSSKNNRSLLHYLLYRAALDADVDLAA